MQWTSLNDLREKFLAFFESKGHMRLKSFSLVPSNDKSLLLINSGMAPMKKFFTGEVTPPSKRVCTCQKCIRTPDLERVGHTARHGTYFEMLGNFSFGDYFKEEAICYAWEFLTRVLEIPADRLWPSVYEEDAQALAIWRDVIGVPAEHIIPLGKADNFWEHGTGPCGPCSEIYFDRGEKYGCGGADCKPGCDCDRFMEIWNNVFSQFNSDGKGNYTELENKNIDTGMGLERLACVMQGVDNLFEVDTVRKILDTVCSIANKTYGADKEQDISIRVVTDHIRSATFMICDGVLPSNEGRGYVLRRILRRACRHGKLLGIERKFLPELCSVVLEQNRLAFPELVEREDYILKVIALEEERFRQTLDSGLAMLEKLIENAVEEGNDSLSGAAAFKLYDTYGFPPDLTREIAAERVLSVDEEGFTTLMKEQKDRARAARGSISGWAEGDKGALSDVPATEFLGYEQSTTEAKVLLLLADGESTGVLDGEGVIITDRTVFYGEGGGQVGDTGYMGNMQTRVCVLDTKKTDGVYMHTVRVEEGSVRVGDSLTLCIDEERREAICRSHTATHLLQAALRSVVGTHIEQAGSYVDERELRFDFSHYAALEEDQLAEVERLVNANILKAEAVVTVQTDMEGARAAGAMALFDGKYGDTVRLVRAGSTSVELCGGTHVQNTGNIGLFKIVSEASVAAGVRRVVAVTGTGVLALLEQKQQLLKSTAAALKCPNLADVEKKAQTLQAELREAKRAAEALQGKLSALEAASLMDRMQTVGPFRLLVAEVQMRPDAARTLCDTVKAKHPDAVCVLAAVSEGKLSFVAAAGTEAVGNGAHAGKLLSRVAVVCGGKGGGRPDSAMAGGKELEKIPEALALVAQILGEPA